MTEAQSTEIEKVLLYISDAQDRAKRAAAALDKADPDPNLGHALQRADEALGKAHRQLMQDTYYAVHEEHEQLAV